MQEMILLDELIINKGQNKYELNKVFEKSNVNIKLYDEIYLGNTYKHNWKCKCGDIMIGKRYSTIRTSFVNNGEYICDKCKREKLELNYKHQVEESGEWEYIKCFLKGEIKDDGKRAKEVYIQVKHKYCGELTETTPWSFINTQVKCGKCCGCYENSIAYYIEKELEMNLEDVWDFELNNKHPKAVSVGTSSKYWFKCQKEDDDGNKYHGSYKTTCHRFKDRQSRGCPYCGKRTKVHKKDSLGYLYPNIARLLPKDIDVFSLAPSTKVEYEIICPECGEKHHKKRCTNDLITNGFSCYYCGDGISRPEKFMINILTRVGVKYTYQLTKNKQSWCKRYQYDFYLDDLEVIVEIHGYQHYKSSFSTLGGRTLKEEQVNDRAKMKLAYDNGFNDNSYIIVKAEQVEMDYLKFNIINSLKDIVDFSNLSDECWIECWIKCQKSIVSDVWDDYNSGMVSIDELVEKYKLHEGTIRKYLRRGSDVGKCNYKTVEELREERLVSIMDYYNEKGKINEKDVEFLSKELNVSKNTIREHLYHLREEQNIIYENNIEISLKNKVKTIELYRAGENINQIAEILDLSKSTIRNYLKDLPKEELIPVVCVDTGEIFEDVDIASAKYDTKSENIITCCKSKNKNLVAGKDEDEYLRWKFYEEDGE